MAHAPPRVVLVDARKAQHERTGIGRFTLELLTAMVEQGVPLVALTSTAWPDLSGIPCRALRRGPMWHLAALREVVRRRGSVYLALGSLILPALLGRRSGVMVFDLVPLTHPERQARRAVLFYRVLFRTAVRRARYVFVMTEATRQLVTDRFRTRTTPVVTSAGVGAAFYAVGDARPDRPDGRAFLYVGTIEPRKNVLLLLEAFVAAAQPGWTLCLAGKMGWMSETEQTRFHDLLAASCGRVTWTGFVPDGELLELYAASDVFAYPSSAEGFGLPVAEAMAAGLPVVTTADPSIAEVAGDAAELLPVTLTSEDLGAALTAVAADPDRRRQMRAAGRARAAAYTWGRTAAAISGPLLDSTADDQPRPGAP